MNFLDSSASSSGWLGGWVGSSEGSQGYRRASARTEALLGRGVRRSGRTAWVERGARWSWLSSPTDPQGADAASGGAGGGAGRGELSGKSGRSAGEARGLVVGELEVREDVLRVVVVVEVFEELHGLIGTS